MKHIKLFALILALALCLAACGGSTDPEAGGETDEPALPVDLVQLDGPKAGDTVAVFTTDKGTFKAVIYEDLAPLAAENFITHAKNGYYNGVSFHRVIEDFIVQSGDPTGVGNGGESIWGEPFRNEYSEQLHHFYGALCMANARTDQNKSQFYVVTATSVADALVSQMQQAAWDEDVITAYKKLGGTPHLDFRFTVFGHVYEGMDVAVKISQVETDSNDRPVEDVIVESITIETYTEG